MRRARRATGLFTMVLVAGVPLTATASDSTPQVTWTQTFASDAVVAHVQAGGGDVLLVGAGSQSQELDEVARALRSVLEGEGTVGRVLSGSGLGDVRELDDGKTPPLAFAPSREVEIGAWVGSVGHGEGGVWTLNTGLVSNAHGRRSGGVLQTQIPLNPGNSGGPVFDRDGAVVGVVTAGIQGANAINFAITAEAAMLALPHARPVSNCLVIHAPQGAPVFVDGQLVGQGPRAVVLATKRRYEVAAQVGARRSKRTVIFPSQREVVLR